ncbi:MAG: O-antigen ligase family protein [Planctomyces sp.]|nr:O-antigen ligase family protein [Planctomyces sp.]
MFSSVCAAIARGVLALTLVVAPWPFGSAPLSWQPLVFVGVLAALGLWWLSVLSRPSTHSEGNTVLVDSLLPPLLMIMLAALQLAPLVDRPEAPARAVMLDAIPEGSSLRESQGLTPASIYPAATRLEASRMLLALCAGFLGVQLFGDARRRMWLYVPVALNAAILSGFGIWQKLNWDAWGRKLFGQFDLQGGGLPFASFVNRNNAAGFLNLGLAAAAAWAFLAMAPRLAGGFRRVSDADAPRARKAPADADQPLFSPRAILPVAVMVLIAAGVIASASRGGLIALAAAAVVGFWFCLQSRRARLGLALVGIVLPLVVVVVMWFGVGEEVRSRMSGWIAGESKDNRLTHWQETMGAVSDSPWLGGGLGAYGYINRPYQSHASLGWYANADNQFFEWLVEVGILGMTLIVAFLAMFAMDVRRLVRSRAPWEQRDAALLGGMLLASQATQSLTDFGIIISANLLTAAVLAGAMFGAAARSLPFDIVSTAHGPSVLRRGGAALLGIALLMGGWFAWSEVRLAGQAFAARDRIPPLDRPTVLQGADLIIAQARLQSAAELRPDDAELQRALGQLLLFRYRQEAAQALRQDARFSLMSDDRVWSQAAIERVVVSPDSLESEEQLERRREALRALDPNTLLPAALLAYQRASLACPRMPLVSERAATIQLVLQDDTASVPDALYREALTAPADPTRLMEVAALGSLVNIDSFCIACLQRSLELQPRGMGSAMRILEGWKGDISRLRDLLSNDPLRLLVVAEASVGTPVALSLAAEVERILADLPADAAGRDGQLGRVKQLQGDQNAALELYEQAIRQAPADTGWRIRAAELLVQQGQAERAIAHLKAAQEIAPRDPTIRKKLLELESPPQRR